MSSRVLPLLLPRPRPLLPRATHLRDECQRQECPRFYRRETNQVACLFVPRQEDTVHLRGCSLYTERTRCRIPSYQPNPLVLMMRISRRRRGVGPLGCSSRGATIRRKLPVVHPVLVRAVQQQIFSLLTTVPPSRRVRPSVTSTQH